MKETSIWKQIFSENDNYEEIYFFPKQAAGSPVALSCSVGSLAGQAAADIAAAFSANLRALFSQPKQLSLRDNSEKIHGKSPMP